MINKYGIGDIVKYTQNNKIKVGKIYRLGTPLFKKYSSIIGREDASIPDDPVIGYYAIGSMGSFIESDIIELIDLENGIQ